MKNLQHTCIQSNSECNSFLSNDFIFWHGRVATFNDFLFFEQVIFPFLLFRQPAYFLAVIGLNPTSRKWQKGIFKKTVVVYNGMKYK